jgi:hypothetical protein
VETPFAAAAGDYEHDAYPNGYHDGNQDQWHAYAGEKSTNQDKIANKITPCPFHDKPLRLQNVKGEIYPRRLHQKPPPPNNKNNTTMRMIISVVPMMISSIYFVVYWISVLFPSISLKGLSFS